MKVAKIADIQNLADGSVIGEMSVVVKAVFPPRTGTNKKTGTEWKATNTVLQDATGEIRATFWDMDVADLKNQRITIKSSAGKKGLAGLAVKFSDYANANELSISDKASITTDADGKVAEIRSVKAPSGGSFVSASPSRGVDKTTARKIIFNNAKLYVECVKSVGWISSQVEQMSEAHFQAAVASMFISAERAGLASAFAEEEAVKEEPKAPEPKTEADDDDDDIKW